MNKQTNKRMETNKTSSFKRKPLSDCTNTITSHSDRRKLPKSSISIAADSRNPKPPKSSISILPESTQSKTLKSSISIPSNQIYKPPKSSISIANPARLSVSIPAVHFNPRKSSISIAASDNDPRVIATSSSPNSFASSGSASSPPASRAPPSVSEIGDHERSAIPVSQGQRQDAKTRKDKGKMVVDTPIIQVSNPFPPPTQELSLATAPGNDHLSGPDAIQHKNLNARLQKDKGTMVFEGPSIRASDPVTPNTGLLVSSSSALDDRHDGRSEPPVSQSLRLDAKTRIDKGKMVMETPIIQISKPFTPSTLQLSTSAASGSSYLPTHDVIQSKKLDAQPRKDKGKMVLEDSSIETSDPMTPIAAQLLSSSSASDDRHDGGSEPPVSQSLRLDAKTRIDKGKMVMETPIIQISKPFTPSTLQLSTSAASGSSYLPTHDVIQSKKLDAQPRKDKGKMVLEDSSIETSDPMTPIAAQLLSSSSASGVQDEEKTNLKTFYGQRRYSLRRQHVALTSAPLSCPRKKMKRKGVGFGDGDDEKTGSRTDPLPLHKKKQSRSKKNEAMHGMPQDEIERLKSYFADIDAFQLPEEVASDDDSD